MSHKDFHGDCVFAMKYGSDASCIYEYICFLFDFYKNKKKNFHDGFFWVFLSLKDFQARYPFLTYDMIREAIKKLTDGCTSHITKEFVPPVITNRIIDGNSAYTII